MDKIINSILTEWAYRVPDGMPNPKNPLHLVHLEKSLNELNLPKSVVKKVLEKVRKYVDNSMNRKLNRVGEPWGSEGKPQTDGSSDVDKDTEEKDVAKDTEEKKQKADKEREKLKKKNSEELNEGVMDETDIKKRTSNLEAQAEWDYDDKEEEKLIKSLEKYEKFLLDRLEKGTFDERLLAIQSLAMVYTRRKNSDLGKNQIWKEERDLTMANMKNLKELYDEADPKKVEVGVRKVRSKIKVSEEELNIMYDALPPHLRAALERKGKVTQKQNKQHFLGYVKKDGTITSDHSDPDIKLDENGEKVVKRGGVGNKARGMVVFRIYVEQGGLCAYSGLPLQLEKMDLEHVVGFENKDNGSPTQEDYHNREHEANQVLCSSPLNQNKKDMNMEDFEKFIQDNEMGKTDKDYEILKDAYGSANALKSTTEQTALSNVTEITYETEGGGSITKVDYDLLPEDERPTLNTTEEGTPQVKDAVISPEHNADSIKKVMDADRKIYTDLREELLKNPDLDPEDAKSIKKIDSKIGKRMMNAMGLGGNVKDPSGRRSRTLSNNDKAYQSYVEVIAGAPPEDRELFKKQWTKCRRHVESDEVRGVKPHPNFDPNKKPHDTKNPEWLDTLVFPKGHKKAGQNAGNQNQTREFRKCIQNATYPEGHKKAGQKMVKFRDEYKKYWEIGPQQGVRIK